MAVEEGKAGIVGTIEDGGAKVLRSVVLPFGLRLVATETIEPSLIWDTLVALGRFEAPTQLYIESTYPTEPEAIQLNLRDLGSHRNIITNTKSPSKF